MQSTYIQQHKIYSIALMVFATLFGSFMGCGSDGGGGLVPSEIVSTSPDGGGNTSPGSGTTGSDPGTEVGTGTSPGTGETGSGTGTGTDTGTDTRTGTNTATPDIIAPTVNTTNPADALTGVAINEKIAITFSEVMDPLTITPATIALSGPGAITITGVVTYAPTSTTATFTPSSLLANSTLYTVTVTTGTRDLAGNALVNDFVFSFTTGVAPDLTRPTVTSTSPADADVGVAFNTTITATFSEAMDPSLITTDSYTVTLPDLTLVTGTVGYDSASKIATFTPNASLAPNTTFTATINTGVQDLAGNALLSNFVWTFTTGAAPDLISPTITLTNPANFDISVALNKTIVATFSEEMKASTLTTGTYTLTLPDLTPVTGMVDYDSANNVATFTPNASLAPNTTFTATINAGVQDLAGNVLVSNFVWTFTTGAAPDLIRPTITVTNPANFDISVALNKTIVATFSEEMKASTLTTGTYTLTLPDLTPVTGTVDYDSATNIATFTPDADLAPNTIFIATITTGVQDLAGNALLANKVFSFTTGIQTAQTVIQDPVPLLATSSFAILASAAITNIATSHITGDVGLTPDSGSNITGFSVPEFCPEVIGKVYAVDAAGPACALIDPIFLIAAKSAAKFAFDNARAIVRGTPQVISGNLNGMTLYPGLYESGTSLEISPGGFLTLDAQWDANAVFIIRSATSITTESTSEVVLTKGAKASNVYWTAGSTVTLGTNSIMKGTMIAGTALSLLTGANLEGRALNQGPAAAAITLDSCTITVPSP